MSKQMRSVAGSSAMLTGCLATERLLALVGVTLCVGPLDIGSAFGVADTGLALLLAQRLTQISLDAPVVGPLGWVLSDQWCCSKLGTAVLLAGKWLHCGLTRPESQLYPQRDFLYCVSP